MGGSRLRRSMVSRFRQELVSSESFKGVHQVTAKKLNNARYLTKEGKLVSGLKLYEEIIKFDPRDGYVWLEYADALTDLLRFREATDAYQQALNYAPVDRKCFVYARLGILSEQSTSIVEAGNYYKMAVDGLVEPTPWVEILYGKNLLLQGRYKEAENSLAHAAEIESPERTEAYLNLALLFRASARYDDAKEMVMKILSIDPRDRLAKELDLSLKKTKQI